jgi:hypothetical protein
MVNILSDGMESSPATFRQVDMRGRQVKMSRHRALVRWVVISSAVLVGCKGRQIPLSR